MLRPKTTTNDAVASLSASVNPRDNGPTALRAPDATKPGDRVQRHA